MRATLSVLLLAAQLPFGSCLDDQGVICTANLVYGLSVTLTDADTGAPISGATLTLTEGDFSEVMMELDAGQYVGAGERAGTYRLTIEADGFAPRTEENIVITANVCHVNPVALPISLMAQ